VIIMTRRGTLVAIAAGLALAALIVGVAWRAGLIFDKPGTPIGSPVPVDSGSVRVIASNLEVPWGVAFLPDKSALVTERNSAKILSVTPDGQVLQIQQLPEVVPGGEGGLLGIAVAPTYASDGWVYVYYTAAQDNRIARLHLGQAPQPIFTGIPKAGNHNGGRMAFGPDGLLYAGTGDAGDRDRAQDKAYLGGKILRLTPDGQPAPGNPFPGSPVYSYGHRNVQGLAWDSAGNLYASEFGQNRFDELNRIQPGKNYGWPIVEGMGDDSAYVNPLAVWDTSDASPSGIAIVDDKVYMACLRGTKLYQITVDGKVVRPLLDGEFGRLRAAALAPDGSLWILTSNRDGRGSPVPADDRIIRLVL
jgi:glucose/arabinose dehydrogenase